MSWEEEYTRKLVTAEEAVSIIKSGDLVALSLGLEPQALCEALIARLDELQDVEIHLCTPLTDFGWFQPGLEKSFKINVVSFVSQVVRPMIDERRADYSPELFSLQGKAETEGRPGIRGTDVFMTIVSPPDKNSPPGLLLIRIARAATASAVFISASRPGIYDEKAEVIATDLPFSI